MGNRRAEKLSRQAINKLERKTGAKHKDTETRLSWTAGPDTIKDRFQGAKGSINNQHKLAKEEIDNIKKDSLSKVKEGSTIKIVTAETIENIDKNHQIAEKNLKEIEKEVLSIFVKQFSDELNNNIEHNYDNIAIDDLKKNREIIDALLKKKEQTADDYIDIFNNGGSGDLICEFYSKIDKYFDKSVDQQGLDKAVEIFNKNILEDLKLFAQNEIRKIDEKIKKISLDQPKDSIEKKEPELKITRSEKLINGEIKLEETKKKINKEALEEFEKKDKLSQEEKEIKKSLIQRIRESTTKIKQLEKELEKIPSVTGKEFHRIIPKESKEPLAESIPDKQSQPGASEIKEHTPEEKERIKKTRAFVEKLIKDNKYDFNHEDLKGDNEEERQENFKKVILRVMNDFVTHGIPSRDNNGKLKLNKISDLDGKCVLSILKETGFDISKTEYVVPGNSVDGKVIFDTGGKDGISFDEKIMAFFADHHGPNSPRVSSATRLIYEVLKDLDLLKGEEHLEKLVKFVTEIDSQSFALDKKEYFSENFSRSLLGLRNFVRFDKKEGAEKLVQYFKDNQDKDYNEIIRTPLDDAALGKLGFIEEKTKNRKKEEANRQEEVHKKLNKSKEALEELEKKGLIINSGKLGRLAIDIGGTVPNGYEAARAFECDSYFKWDPANNNFFISSKNDLDNVKLNQGKLIRHRMILKPIEEGRLEISICAVLRELIDKEKGENIEPVFASLIKYQGEMKEKDYAKRLEGAGENSADWLDKEISAQKEIVSDWTKAFDQESSAKKNEFSEINKSLEYFNLNDLSENFKKSILDLANGYLQELIKIKEGEVDEQPIESVSDKQTQPENQKSNQDQNSQEIGDLKNELKAQEIDLANSENILKSLDKNNKKNVKIKIKERIELIKERISNLKNRIDILEGEEIDSFIPSEEENFELQKILKKAQKGTKVDSGKIFIGKTYMRKVGIDDQFKLYGEKDGVETSPIEKIIKCKDGSFILEINTSYYRLRQLGKINYENIKAEPGNKDKEPNESEKQSVMEEFRKMWKENILQQRANGVPFDEIRGLKGEEGKRVMSSFGKYFGFGNPMEIEINKIIDEIKLEELKAQNNSETEKINNSNYIKKADGDFNDKKSEIDNNEEMSDKVKKVLKEKIQRDYYNFKDKIEKINSEEKAELSSYNMEYEKFKKFLGQSTEDVLNRFKQQLRKFEKKLNDEGKEPEDIEEKTKWFKDNINTLANYMVKSHLHGERPDKDEKLESREAENDKINNKEGNKSFENIKLDFEEAKNKYHEFYRAHSESTKSVKKNKRSEVRPDSELAKAKIEYEKAKKDYADELKKNGEAFKVVQFISKNRFELQEIDKEQYSQKEKGVFRKAVENGWKWYSQKNKVVKLVVSTAVITGVASGFGVLSLGSIPAYALYRVGRGAVSMVAGTALGTVANKWATGRIDKRYDKDIKEIEKGLQEGSMSFEEAQIKMDKALDFKNDQEKKKMWLIGLATIFGGVGAMAGVGVAEAEYHSSGATNGAQKDMSGMGKINKDVATTGTEIEKDMPEKIKYGGVEQSQVAPEIKNQINIDIENSGGSRISHFQGNSGGGVLNIEKGNIEGSMKDYLINQKEIEPGEAGKIAHAAATDYANKNSISFDKLNQINSGSKLTFNVDNDGKISIKNFEDIGGTKGHSGAGDNKIGGNDNPPPIVEKGEKIFNPGGKYSPEQLKNFEEALGSKEITAETGHIGQKMLNISPTFLDDVGIKMDGQGKFSPLDQSRIKFISEHRELFNESEQPKKIIDRIINSQNKIDFLNEHPELFTKYELNNNNIERLLNDWDNYKQGNFHPKINLADQEKIIEMNEMLKEQGLKPVPIDIDEAPKTGKAFLQPDNSVKVEGQGITGVKVEEGSFYKDLKLTDAVKAKIENIHNGEIKNIIFKNGQYNSAELETYLSNNKISRSQIYKYYVDHGGNSSDVEKAIKVRVDDKFIGKSTESVMLERGKITAFRNFMENKFFKKF